MMWDEVFMFLCKFSVSLELGFYFGLVNLVLFVLLKNFRKIKV